jgi:ABC-2 type transport system permease protein
MPHKTRKTPGKTQPQPEREAVAVGAGAAAQEHAWRNIRLIIAREYKSRVAQRGFWVGTIILLVVVAAAAFVPTIVQVVSSRSKAQTHVVVVNNAGLDDTTLLSSLNAILNGTSTSGKPPYAIALQPPADLGSLQGQVKNGKLAILLLLDRAAGGDLHLTYTTNTTFVADTNLPRIQVVAQQLTFLDRAQRLGLTSPQTGSLLAPPDLTTVNTRQSQGMRPVNELIAGYVLAFAGSFLIYQPVMIYAGSVAAGVAEEKSSRVMELLVTAATPRQLMAGKIVGIGAACLTQMGCVVLVGIGALLLQTPLQAVLFGASGGGFIRYLTGVSIPFYLLFLLYFLLAFFLYASLYAGLGAMVKRQEEVQGAVQVPMMLSIVGWVLVYLAAYFPNTASVRLLSYIPFFAPTMMMVRLALGTVAWWEIVLTVALLMGSIYVCALFGARLYRYGVLLYGQKPGLRQLVKMVWRQ